MTWSLYQWVWRLEAPLFIGMPPAGALNRCRLYVPARALWGAITAELARLDSNDKGASPDDYEKFGAEVRTNYRFTYLYPAEKVGNDYAVWLPKFEKRGLIWRRWDGKGNNNKNLSDRDFRRRLLDSRPGTAIAPETDSASEGTLRETECINPWWRNLTDHQTKPSPVFLLGYVFLKDKDTSFHEQIKKNIKTLFVGGDTRYGLGKICRVKWDNLFDDLSVFGKPVHLDNENPEIQSDIVWGHALECGQTPIPGMQGMKELLGGWEQSNPWKGALAWAPGSSLKHPAAWSIDNYGCWIHQLQTTNSEDKE